MRTFLLSLSLLLLTIGLCIWSFVAVNAHTQDLYTLVETIDTPSTEEALADPAVLIAIADFQSTWRSKRFLLEIGISEHTLYEIERALAEIESAARATDLAAFLSARATLSLSVARLRHLEQTVL